MNYGSDRQVRLYFTSSELCKELGIDSNILKSWELSFANCIKPKKNRAGKKVFKPKDLHYCLFIKNCFASGWKRADIMFQLQNKTEKEILLMVEEPEFKAAPQFHPKKQNLQIPDQVKLWLRKELLEIKKLLTSS